MSLTAPQQASLETPTIRFAYFAEFSFATATVRVSSLNMTVNWGGFDWIGLGSLANISTIEEAMGTTASALTFDLNLVQPEFLSLGVGAVEEYRGRDAKMYFCPLDEAFRLVDTPQVCWRGTMDTMVSNISGKRGESAGTLSLKCETSAYGLKRKPSMRINAAQHKLKHPSDRGLDYLNDLTINPDKWVSIRFQQR